MRGLHSPVIVNARVGSGLLPAADPKTQEERVAQKGGAWRRAKAVIG